MTQHKSHTFVNVQCLRAFAAFLVFIHHTGPQFVAAGQHSDWFLALAKIGPAGVDLFFVISGFVLAHTTADKSFNLGGVKRFLGRRIFRIYLGYWPFFLLTLLFAILVNPAALVNVNWVASVFLTNRNMETLLLPVAWTLVYELYFYVIFALILLAPTRWRLHIFGMLFALILVNPLLPLQKNEPMRMVLSFAFVEFFLGVFLYQLQHKLTSNWLALALLVGGVVLGCSAVEHNLWFGITRGCSIGGAAVMLVAAAVILEKNRQCTVSSWLVAVGDASYTLYLSNILLLNCFAYSGLRDWLAAKPWPYFNVGFVIVIVCVPALSVVFYRYIEKPLYRAAVRRWID